MIFIFCYAFHFIFKFLVNFFKVTFWCSFQNIFYLKSNYALHNLEKLYFFFYFLYLNITGHLLRIAPSKKIVFLRDKSKGSWVVKIIDFIYFTKFSFGIIKEIYVSEEEWRPSWSFYQEIVVFGGKINISITLTNIAQKIVTHPIVKIKQKKKIL